MSANFEASSNLAPTDQTSGAVRYPRLQRVIESGGRLAGRAFLAVSLAAGVAAAEMVVVPNPAVADDGGYPDANASYCGPDYQWCKGGTDISPRGYAYRNCTDWAAYRASQLTGKSVPPGMRHAKYWDNNAPSTWIVDTTPESGDIAQSETADPYGHVGVVEAVEKDSNGRITSIKVSEYNKLGTGLYTIYSYTPDSQGVFWRNIAHTKKWDHFLDLNGTDKGINGASQEASAPPPPDTDGDGVADPHDACPSKPGLAANRGCPVMHVYAGTTNGRIYETYWGYGNALTTGQLANVSSPVTAVTNQIENNGLQHVYFGTQGGEVYETYWGGGNTLTTSRLTDLDSPVESISSQITPDGTQHVYTGAQDGRINETYWGPNNALTTWQVANVGSPVEALATDITSGSTQHIYSGTADGKVRESYWGPNDSLTTYQLANVGSSVVALDSGITGDRVNHVMTSTADGRSFETYWGGGNALTTAQMANLGTTITDMAARYNGTWHIYNGTSAGTIKETYWGGGFNLATGELLNAGSPVASVTASITPDNVQHVFTATQDGKLRETYWGGGNSLTTAQMANLGAGVGITDIFSRSR